MSHTTHTLHRTRSRARLRQPRPFFGTHASWLRRALFHLVHWEKSPKLEIVRLDEDSGSARLQERA